MKVNIKDNLILGIKRTIPVIVVFSILMALRDYHIILENLADIASMLLIPVLAFNITFAFSKYHFTVPAVILGYFAFTFNTGFLGGLLVGLTVGYFSLKFKYAFTGNLNKDIFRLIIYNIIIFGILFPMFYYLIFPPVDYILVRLFDYLINFDTSRVMILVGILSLLTTLDLGGPFNKVAFAFLIQAVLNEYYHIIGPVMISVTIPPLSIFLGLLIYKNRFSQIDKSQIKMAGLSSAFGLTEGAMAVTFRRIKILPVIMIGSLLGSLFASYMGLESKLLMASIPGLFGTSNIWIYLLSHLIGVSFSLIMFPIILKRNVETKEDLV